VPAAHLRFILNDWRRPAASTLTTLLSWPPMSMIVMAAGRPGRRRAPGSRSRSCVALGDEGHVVAAVAGGHRRGDVACEAPAISAPHPGRRARSARSRCPTLAHRMAEQRPPASISATLVREEPRSSPRYRGGRRAGGGSRRASSLAHRCRGRCSQRRPSASARASRLRQRCPLPAKIRCVAWGGTGNPPPSTRSARSAQGGCEGGLAEAARVLGGESARGGRNPSAARCRPRCRRRAAGRRARRPGAAHAASASARCRARPGNPRSACGCSRARPAPMSASVSGLARHGRA
jgi:hypothetical protein